MKDINIRLWDKELKQMIYLNKEQLDNGIAYLNNKHLEDESPIYMLGIGSKDENGNEIYECDIVDCLRDGDTEYISCVVINDIRNLPRDLFGSSLISRKVIGNIYENKDILD